MSNSPQLVSYERRITEAYEQWILHDATGFREHVANMQEKPIDSFYSNSEAETHLVNIVAALDVIRRFEATSDYV